MLGMFDWTPKFVRRYGDLRRQIEAAAEAYAQDVRDREFPGAQEIYRLVKAVSNSP
jgi:3-methyl-2-oxobutanoate hydroxymethyltransferase